MTITSIYSAVLGLRERQELAVLGLLEKVIAGEDAITTADLAVEIVDAVNDMDMVKGVEGADRSLPSKPRFRVPARSL